MKRHHADCKSPNMIKLSVVVPHGVHSEATEVANRLLPVINTELRYYDMSATFYRTTRGHQLSHADRTLTIYSCVDYVSEVMNWFNVHIPSVPMAFFELFLRDPGNGCSDLVGYI